MDVAGLKARLNITAAVTSPRCVRRVQIHGQLEDSRAPDGWCSAEPAGPATELTEVDIFRLQIVLRKPLTTMDIGSHRSVVIRKRHTAVILWNLNGSKLLCTAALSLVLRIHNTGQENFFALYL